MNTQNLIPLSTTIEGLAGNSITLFGPESRDFEASFDADGIALVPLDVAATSCVTEGFKVSLEHFDTVASYNARQLELARSPIPAYDAGELVDLHIPQLAGANGLAGLKMVAGDNLTVVFDGEGKTECGEKTARTFTDFFTDAVITPKASKEKEPVVEKSAVSKEEANSKDKEEAKKEEPKQEKAPRQGQTSKATKEAKAPKTPKTTEEKKAPEGETPTEEKTSTEGTTSTEEGTSTQEGATTA